MPMALKYIGIKKHKRWIPGGTFGSICPDWTHTVNGRHFGNAAPESWNGWPKAEAQKLLTNSVAHGCQRYAAARGIAFCGQITGGNTWHGYPIPWRDVPEGVRQRLVAKGQVSSREIKQGMRAQQTVDPKRDVTWALNSDGE